jgi:PleD family two-component response regulator
VPPVDEVAPGLPPRVVRIVEKLMSWDPAGRYQEPAEVVADLEAVLRELNGVAIAAEPEKEEDSDAEDAPPKSSEKPAPSVLIVEGRPKRQDLLRDYLGKRGFRPLFLADASRAVARLDSSPPDSVVLMGEFLGDDLFDLFPKVLGLTQELPLVAVFVLSEGQRDRRRELDETSTCRVIVQPITARDLRKQIQLGLKEVLTQSRLIKLPPISE